MTEATREVIEELRRAADEIRRAKERGFDETHETWSGGEDGDGGYAIERLRTCGTDRTEDGAAGIIDILRDDSTGV